MTLQVMGKVAEQWASLFGSTSRKQTPAEHEPKLSECCGATPPAESHTFRVKSRVKKSYWERHLFHLMVSLHRKKGLLSVTVPDVTFTKTSFKTEQMILARLWVL